MKDLSVENQIYLCKYHDIDTSLPTTIGITDEEAKALIQKYKDNGLYDQYRNMDEREYESICKRQKKMDKCEKILDKYKFEPGRSYKRMYDLLKECDLTKQTNINRTCKNLGSRKGCESQSIINDCNRAIELAYRNNPKLFEMYEYEGKPTLKEFVTKELGLQDANVEQNAPSEIIERVDAPCEDVISDITKATMESKVEISLKELLNYYYLKGYFDAIKEK